MKRLVLFSLLVVTLIYSCSEDSDSSNEANSVATYQIGGMICEMGCGASIRKGLFKTGSVADVEVDFDENNPSNLIKVYYNDQQTSPEDMKKVIESINENQFQADFIDTKKIADEEKKNYKLDDSSKGSSSKGVNASSRTFSLPNLTELVNSLIH